MLRAADTGTLKEVLVLLPKVPLEVKAGISGGRVLS
jgi:hypothetical protein